jgi:hypothetical protein
MALYLPHFAQWRWAGWLLSGSSPNNVVVRSMCDWKLDVKPVESIGGPVRSLIPLVVCRTRDGT